MHRDRHIRRFLALLALALGGSLVVPATADAASFPAPLVGHFDSISVSTQQVVLHGWAADTRRPHTSLAVRYRLVDVASNTLVEAGAGIAHDPRPDVGAAFPSIGPSHGFNLAVYLPGSTVRVCLSVVEPASGGPDLPLNCLTATVPSDHPSVGHFDSLAAAPNAHLTVSGWALDPDTPTASISVIVLIGGHSIPPAFSATSVLANSSRPDVAAVYRSAGAAHGFRRTLPAKAGTYPVCLYATGTYIYGSTRFLGCRSVTV